jgi:hypothetical protein
MSQKKDKKLCRNRLNYMAGQINGIVKMLDEGRSEEEINNVMLAVSKGMDLMIKEKFPDLCRLKLAGLIVSIPKDYTITLEISIRLTVIKKSFPDYTDKEVRKTLLELAEIIIILLA